MKQTIDPKQQTTERPTAQELHISVPRAIARVEQEAEQEQSIIDALVRHEDSAALFERRVRLIEQCRIAAIRATAPEDWVLFRGKDGSTNAMLTAPGAAVVAHYYGIEIYNLRPMRDGVFSPVRTEDGDEVSYAAWCDARCNVTGQSVESIEARRSSSEDFVGRGGLSGTSALVADADLRAATAQLLKTKAVRILAAMSRVPLRVLEEAWRPVEGKSTSDCRLGSGFGSAKDRGAGRVAEEGVKEAAAALGRDVLSRVGGDEDAAKDLLRDITSNPEKGFKGFDSARRFTQSWQVERAWKALREHELFGDDTDKEATP